MHGKNDDHPKLDSFLAFFHLKRENKVEKLTAKELEQRLKEAKQEESNAHGRFYGGA